MADSLPRIDVDGVHHLVDEATFERGQNYADRGAVVSLSWSEGRASLTAVVLGNAPAPYQCRIDLESTGAGRLPTYSGCSCPVGRLCKHIIATLISCHDRASQHQPPAAEVTWRTGLELLSAPPTQVRTPLALGFFGGPDPAGKTGQRSLNPAVGARELDVPQPALHVRPVTRGKSGAWIKGSLTWRTLAHQIHRLELDPDQLRWFTQFLGLYDATRTRYTSVDTHGLPLSDCYSPLLWTLLAQAPKRGIELVAMDPALRVGLVDEAHVDVTASSDTAGALRLQPRIWIDRQFVPADQWALIGDHGIYTWHQDGQHCRIRLAPLHQVLSEEQRRLLDGGDMEIPAVDVQEFYSSYYPQLQALVPVSAADEGVVLPAVPAANLALVATYLPRDTVHLRWRWHYHDPPRQFPFDPDNEQSGQRRNRAREAELIAAAQQVWPEGLRRADHELQDVEAAEFTTRTLPALERLEGVAVEVHGPVPEYDELAGAPNITVTTVETERTDWFDLGFEITIDGRKVPFPRLFEALHRGQKKVLLTDRSYFSLDHPAFDRLRDLLADAEALEEWEPEQPRLSRYQVDLWEEFEDVADQTIAARTWRDSVEQLRAGGHIDPTPLPAGVRAELRPYQRDGFQWLAFLWQHRLGGILADDMGLGKTLQTLSLIAHARLPGAQTQTRGAACPGPFLVIAPTSVVHTWAAQARRFTPDLRVVTVTATGRKRGRSLAQEATGADVVVTSYALARLDAAEFQAQHWGGLVLDEAQFVKNPATRTHREIAAIDAPFRLAITGTPLENSLTDLWALTSITAPGLFPSARRFRQEYVRPIENDHDATRLRRLRRRIRPFMMRRTKEAVAADLPAKQEQVIPVELSRAHRAHYEAVLQRERQKVLGLIEDMDRNRFIVFRSLTLLRMLALAPELIAAEHADVGSSKLETLMEHLSTIAADGHRVLVFSQFTSFLQMAAARWERAGGDYAYLDGSTSGRAQVIEGFRSGEAPVFFISLKAGGFGLTLTEADYVFMLDPWWNPATETQAIDRTHRIGQTRNVMVYRLVAARTIEEKVMALQQQKADLFDAVIDDDAHFAPALTAEDIRGLLE